MAEETLSTCPLSPQGFCLYERCPYWDPERPGCDACFQEAQAGAPGSGSPEFPCTLNWTEDGD